MTTMEHLFTQIFDRRRWIEEQLRQQVDSYGQSLACNVIADGRKPPEWLLNTGSEACWYAEPRGIALSEPWISTPKTNNYALYTLPRKNVSSSHSNNYINHITTDVHIEDIDEAVPKSHQNDDNRDIQAVSIDVAETFNELDSFVTIQRSRSRQRDLENRLNSETKDALLEDQPKVGQSSHTMMGCKFTSTKSNNVNESLVIKNSDPSNSDTTKAAFTTQVAQDHATVSGISHFITSKSSIGNRLPGSTDQTATNQALASPASASRSRAHFLVTAKELSFENSETSHPRKKRYDSYPGGKKQGYNFETTGGGIMHMESLKDDSSCRDSVFGSSEAIQCMGDVFDTQVLETTRITQVSVQNPAQNLVTKVDDFQFHSASDSGNKTLQMPPPILDNIHYGSSSEQQSGQCLPNVLANTLGISRYVTAPPAYDNPSDKLVHCDLEMGMLCTAQQNEAEDSNHDISPSMRDDPFCRDAERVLYSSTRQLQGTDVLHAAETTHVEMSRNMVVLGHDKEKNQLSAGETRNTCPSRLCNSVYSHIPIQNDLLLISERDQTVRSLSGRRHMEESTSSYVQSNCSMVLTAEKDEILTKGTENVVVKVVNETCVSPSLTTIVNIDRSSKLECELLLKSSISTHVTSGSVSCSLTRSTDHNAVFRPKDVNHASSAYFPVNFFVHETPTSVEIDNKRELNDCNLTQLSSFCGSFDCGKENQMISSCALSETTKRSFCQASEECTENKVGHIRLNNIISKTEPSKPRYFLRSLSSNEKSVSTSKLNALPVTTKKSVSQASEDCIENGMGHMVSMSIINSKSEPSKPRYFLRSSRSNEKSVCTSNLDASTSASNSMQSFGIIKHSYETSWPKRRKIVYHSNAVLATSPSMRVNRHKCNDVDVQCRSKESLEGTSAPEVQIQLSTHQNEMNTVNPLMVVDQSKKHCLRKVASCSRNVDQTVHSVTYLAEKSLNTHLLNEIRVDESTSFTSEEHCMSDDHYLSVPGNELNNVASTICNILSNEQTKVPDRQSISYTYDQSYNETLPVFEGFSIGVSPIGKEDIFYNSDFKRNANEQKFTVDELKTSVILSSPMSRPSGKHKINEPSGIFWSLPSGISEQMNTKNILDFYDGYAENALKIKDPGNSGLESDIYSQMSSSFSQPCTGNRFAWEGTKLPLTPIEKASFKKVSIRSDDTEGVGSDLELVCFRIDEDTCAVEETEQIDEKDISQSCKISGVKMSTKRKPLLDVTAFYENVPIGVPLTKKFLERESLETFDSSAYSRFMNNHPNPGNTSTCKKVPKRDEQNQPILDKRDKDQKKAQCLNTRSVNLERKSKACGRNRSQGVLSKGCRPKNIVSSITSFIPLVQKKQQITPAKGKKDIKVKALEAAEAAKRLEEKKQTEREVRKAELKLERTRLEQEKLLKKKQKDEEKKRKQEDTAARKRQREEQEREKKQKRKCTEKSQRLQQEQDTQLKAKKDMEFHHQSEVDNTSAFKLVQDRMSTTEENQDPQSYEMSPCKDSDDDEDDEEEIIRGRKYVPMWARKESLHKILLSKMHLDPTEIFSCKSSFDISEVLSHQAVRRRPL